MKNHDDKKEENYTFYHPNNDKCVSCGQITDVPINLNINYRYDYIEGAGQLCNNCSIKIYSNKFF